MAKPVDLTLEREIQRAVVELYEGLGCEVIRFSQPGRRGSGTRQTPGIPDLRIYCARKRRSWWCEIKTPTGRQSPAQALFQLIAEACGEAYVLGGMEANLAHCRAIELLAA